MCTRCFLSTHPPPLDTDHAVHTALHSTGCGCCDCGDPEAWKKDLRELNCKYHSPLTEEEQRELEAKRKGNEEDLGAFGLGEEGTGEKQRFREQEQTLGELEATLSVVLDEALNFAVQVLEHSPAEPTHPRELGHVYEEVTHDPRPKVSAPNPPAIAPIESDDEPDFDSWAMELLHAAESDGSKTPTVRSKNLESPKGNVGPWSAILWNDEKHSYQEVIAEVDRAISCGKPQARDIARRVDAKVGILFSVSKFGCAQC